MPETSVDNSHSYHHSLSRTVTGLFLKQCVLRFPTIRSSPLQWSDTQCSRAGDRRSWGFSKDLLLFVLPRTYLLLPEKSSHSNGFLLLGRYWDGQLKASVAFEILCLVKNTFTALNTWTCGSVWVSWKGVHTSNAKSPGLSDGESGLTGVSSLLKNSKMPYTEPENINCRDFSVFLSLRQFMRLFPALSSEWTLATDMCYVLMGVWLEKQLLSNDRVDRSMVRFLAEMEEITLMTT